jgi:hypothetical protein
VRGQGGRGDAGVSEHRADRAARGGQSPLQLKREQHDRQFGVAVGLHGVIGPGAPVEVGQVEAGHPVELAGHADHPVGDAVGQQVGEHKRPEVIGGGLQIQAVGRALGGDVHDAGVVDQHVHRGIGRVDERPDRPEIGHVELADLHLSGRVGEG